MSNEIRPISGLESVAIIWGIAAFAGFGTMALLFFMGDWSPLQAIFAGGSTGFVLGVVLTVMMGRPLPPPNQASAAGGSTTGEADHHGDDDLAPATQKVLKPVPSPHRDSIKPSGISTAFDANTGSAKATIEQGAKLAAQPPGPVEEADGEAMSDADRVPPIGAAAAAEERAEARAAAAQETVQPIGAAVIADEEAEAAAPHSAEPAAESKAPAAKPAPADAGGDGAGKKPELLSAPRDGGADDLKQIKGVGPKLEGELNAKGVYHFDQIASWTDEEIAWADENLVKFKGRVSRDNWRDQAKLLAEGGETEFSKKVSKGDVY